MKFAELKKGDRVMMAVSGWEADIVSKRGKEPTILDCKVYGFETEIGSVYAHDIEFVQVNGEWKTVVHTLKQKKHRELVNSIFP